MIPVLRSSFLCKSIKLWFSQGGGGEKTRRWACSARQPDSNAIDSIREAARSDMPSPICIVPRQRRLKTELIFFSSSALSSAVARSLRCLRAAGNDLPKDLSLSQKHCTAYMHHPTAISIASWLNSAFPLISPTPTKLLMMF